MFNKILLGKILLLLVMLLVVMSGLTVFGCARGSVPKGWSGAVVADDALFFGSMQGKVVAVDTSTHILLETKTTGGGFSCAPTSTTVAIYGTPVVAGDLVYVSGYNGKIYAISRGTGLSKEEYLDEKKPQPIVGGPVVAQGKVYIGCSDGKVYALNAATLKKEWEFPTGNKIWSTPAIDNGTLYIGSFDKKIYALDAATGEKKWEFETQGAITSTPVVYNSTVYIGSFDKYLYAVDTIDGSLVWKSKVEADNWFWAKPVICNNTVYAPCLDGKVYVLNAETGDEVVNAIDLASPISSSPALINDSIIVASENGQVWTIDTGNNQKSELKNLGEKIYAPLCAGDETVYIHTQKGILYEVNAQTGAMRRLYPIE